MSLTAAMMTYRQQLQQLRAASAVKSWEANQRLLTCHKPPSVAILGPRASRRLIFKDLVTGAGSHSCAPPPSPHHLPDLIARKRSSDGRVRRDSVNSVPQEVKVIFRKIKTACRARYKCAEDVPQHKHRGGRSRDEWSAAALDCVSGLVKPPFGPSPCDRRGLAASFCQLSLLT